jgi:hypothetical protein
MSTLADIQKRLQKIEARNKRVEKDKAWETSLMRKVAIAVVTYFTLATYFAFVLKVNPWINAIVPTVGFLLSTLSLSLIKKIWLKYQK